MIGSIDMLAIISSRPVPHIAMTGRLSGTSDQPPHALLPFAAFGRASSRIRKVVPRKVMKMTPPIRKKVLRMPIRPGSTPPINGPTRLPAMIPADSTPIAQPDRAFGVCAATSTVEPEA